MDSRILVKFVHPYSVYRFIHVLRVSMPIFHFALKERQTYSSETSARVRCQGVVSIPP